MEGREQCSVCITAYEKHSIKMSLLFTFIRCVRIFHAELINLHCSLCCIVWRPLKFSSHIITVQIIQHLAFWIIWLFLSQSDIRVPRQPVIGDVKSVGTFHYCTRIDSFFLSAPCFQMIFIQNFLSSLQLLFFRVVVVNSSRTSSLIIYFWSFEIIGLFLSR